VPHVVTFLAVVGRPKTEAKLGEQLAWLAARPVIFLTLGWLVSFWM